MRQIAAGKFKAECLALMDEVRQKREIIVITKRGKPVAKLVPLEQKERKDPIFGFMKGRGRIVGDIVSPIIPLEDWEMLK